MVTTTKGHATFHVEFASAPYVRVVVTANFGTYDATPVVPTTDGAAELEMSTWGLGDATARLQQCSSSSSLSSCTWAGVRRAFHAEDPGPTVVWDDLTFVGAEPAEYSVTVSETDGGGALYAEFAGKFEPLPASGQAILRFPEVDSFSGQIHVARCNSDSQEYCTITDATPSSPLTVRRRLQVHVGYSNTLTGKQYINPDLNPGPDIAVTLTTKDPGLLTLDWWVEPAGSEQPVPGVGGTEQLSIPVLLGRTWVYPRVQLELAKLPHGSYNLNVRLTRSFEDAEPLVAEDEADDGDRILVDTVPPTGAVRVSSTTIYPHRDGYKDGMGIWTGATDDAHSARLEVLDGSGRVVRSMFGWSQQFSWNGRRADGTIVPEGTYTFRVTLKDFVGNKAVVQGGSVTVHHERLVERIFNPTISAARSLRDSWVGRCSTLRRPSGRGWPGSLGYYTNTKCDGDVDESLVVTVHSARVPDAFRYRGLVIKTFGGATKSRPGSFLFLDMRRSDGSWGDKDTRLGYWLASHSGPVRSGRAYVWADRRVVWAVYTAGGAGYDVRDFTVRLKYQVLV